MINVRIYCQKSHKDYETTYNVIKDMLFAYNLDFKIERISEPKVLARQHIVYEPHIVINNQVVYARSCPTRDDVRIILKRIQLI